MVVPNNPRFGVICVEQKYVDTGCVHTNKKLQIMQYASCNNTLNPFLTKVLILCNLKTTGFLVFLGGIKWEHWPLSASSKTHF